MNLLEIIEDLRTCTLVRDCTKKISDYNNETLNILLRLTYSTELPVTWEEIEANIRYVYSKNEHSLETMLNWIDNNLDTDKQLFMEAVCSFLKNTEPESNMIMVQMFKGDLGIKMSKTLIKQLKR